MYMPIQIFGKPPNIKLKSREPPWLSSKLDTKGVYDRWKEADLMNKYLIQSTCV